MAINLSNFLISKNDRSKMADFQDLDHIDGLSISVTSANLYNNKRDDLVLFYFRNGAEYASLYTQSKVISENIKWNLATKTKKIKALLVNARNANCLTGIKGYNSFGLGKMSNLLTFKPDKKTISKDFSIVPNVDESVIGEFNYCNVDEE